MSPSLRGRGLKCAYIGDRADDQTSPSLRGRGLKCQGHPRTSKVFCVALFTRAWIEIRFLLCAVLISHVALFTRAWIEILTIFRFGLPLSGRPLYEGVD